MNQRPFYHHPPSYRQSYTNNPYPSNQQPYSPYYQQNEPLQTQTPFEYFSKPKQPPNWYQYTQQQNPNSFEQQYAPAPKGILSQFQDENGQINLDKMLSTVGQMANTYHQVQPIIKQFGDLIKTFR
ncbi:hypothetical protein GMD78_15265 [Ornithinibacillus sp. L9]|uniref:YppG-like protein n=1 Tax=Ornithinibacillus caprae TaxID=2678566 RepID=A0A6N8FQ96_9BACI|nr:YppG family protein [Ornithinibacillus caprae]MUK89728.1 hypothetical protein [Ornithinibacillus caprae]